jgi:hypothetical protein
MMYENLRKAVHAEYEKRISENSDRILAVDSRNGATKEAMRAAGAWVTKHTQAQYDNGEIGVDSYVIRAEKRMRTTLKKDMKAALAKIDTIEAAEKPESFMLWVTWKRSRTWGANPHTELIVNGDTYRGKATGCGYDKESAAIADALNACPGTVKILYDVKEAALAGDENISNENAIGYGAGYGALPYYERGVGVNTLIAILEKCGYEVKQYYSPERSFFEIEKRRG